MKRVIIHGYKIASIGKRFVAFIIDLIIQLILIYTAKMLLFDLSIDDYFDQEISFNNILFNGFFALILGAITYPFFSGNLGHKLLNLKVIDKKTGENFEKFYDGAIRECFKNLLANFIIPIIWLFFNEQRQNLYDRIVNTCVVERKKVPK